jgi:type II secretory ATPase GspE/PulE/Tfp pilus assembly ATPase PilB-like protein
MASQEINTEHMFRLIETILPFEACLYHQVLPLAVEGQYLYLGMVDLQDQDALSYVRRMIGYINCTLVPRSISSNLHQAMLSAYLNHTDRVASPKENRKQHPDSSRSHSISVGESVSPPKTLEPESGSLASIAAQNQPFDSQTFATVILDPDEDEVEALPSLSTDQAATLPMDSPLNSPSSPSPPPPQIPSQTPIIPSFDIEAYYLASPIEILTELPSKNLLHELLGRAFMGGIGRLYFEHREQYGRILWSQSGVLQSVLDKLDPLLFQGVIDELKDLAGLPLDPIEDLKQVELERLYQKKRLLLRLRFMAGQHGEQATLQVLRGAALKFYEQQQLNRLGKDALSIAQQLQRKLDEIRNRKSTDSPGEEDSKPSLDSLSELHQVLERLNEQLRDLG